VIFRNTELIHDNELADVVASLGYKGILCEGVQSILKGRSLDRLYQSPGDHSIPLLLRNGRLSDRIAFGFNDPRWDDHPLTAEKFADLINGHPEDTEVINLFFDYETFGVHKENSTRIFDFLECFPDAILSHGRFAFQNAAEVVSTVIPHDTYDSSKTISWNDKAIAPYVSFENSEQNNIIKKIYSLERMVVSSHDRELISQWRNVQTADNIYHMDPRVTDNGQRYQNPFTSSSEAHSVMRNILTDFEIRLIHLNLPVLKKRSIVEPVLY